jgi:hypothetical protein
MQVVKGGLNLPPLVGIELIDLPKIGFSEHLQGQSWQTGFFELALRDRNMKVRFF